MHNTVHIAGRVWWFAKRVRSTRGGFGSSVSSGKERAAKPATTRCTSR